MLALTSAKAAIRAQYVIMIGIALSLFSLLLGSPLEETVTHDLNTSMTDSPGFWTVFAVFFPAVNWHYGWGNMSGDLENPKVAIPKGTFAAIGVGYLIYMGLPIILANRASTEALIADPLIMRRISFWGDAILVGVWGQPCQVLSGVYWGHHVYYKHWQEMGYYLKFFVDWQKVQVKMIHQGWEPSLHWL